MDIAVLSDIHGNYIALQRCLEYAFERNISAFIFLGDYLGELAWPQKTMELLYRLKKEYPCWFIKGNKEEYWLNYRKGGEQIWKENDSTTGSLMYTYRNLTERDFDFFEKLPHKQEFSVDGMMPLTICHGSPNRINEKLLPDDENTFAIMEQEKNRIILCGHTHVQNKIEHKGKVVLNGGSAGIPLHGDGRTQFLLLHGSEGQWTEEFISLSYDVERVIADLYEAGLHIMAPCWFKVTKQLLRGGDVSHDRVLERAMELCRQAQGECIWPKIPEEYWEQAVAELVKCT